MKKFLTTKAEFEKPAKAGADLDPAFDDISGVFDFGAPGPGHSSDDTADASDGTADKTGVKIMAAIFHLPSHGDLAALEDGDLAALEDASVELEQAFDNISVDVGPPAVPVSSSIAANPTGKAAAKPCGKTLRLTSYSDLAALKDAGGDLDQAFDNISVDVDPTASANSPVAASGEASADEAEASDDEFLDELCETRIRLPLH